MSYNIIHKSAARWDIADALDYYKTISPKLARQFLARLDSALDQIEEMPLGYQIKYNEVRTLMLKQLPYKIHYLIDNVNRQIVILSVVHANRDPTDYSLR